MSRKIERGALRHLPPTRAMRSQLMAGVFEDLHVGASLLDPIASPWNWQAIYRTPEDVGSFELAYGVESRRKEHNVRSVAAAYREGKPVLGRHAGFYDLFVPIRDAAGTRGVLVAGPFARARATSSDVLTRWRWLTGRHGRVSDPEFLHYLSLTLATTTFDGPLFDTYRRLLECLCRLLSEQGRAEHWAQRAQTLRSELAGARYAERMWEAARVMVDERSWRTWRSRDKRRELQELGPKKPPEHAIVGLLTRANESADPVEDLLARNAFQRACVDLCRARGGILCGRVSDHGIVLLVDDAGSRQRLRSRLMDVGERVAALAKRHGLRLHLGIRAADDDGPLPPRYQAALSAADEALSRGLTVVYAEHERRSVRVSPLGELRRQLGALSSEGPGLLAPHFDRYLEAVVLHCGYRLEPSRAYLEAGFYQIIDALRAGATLDERSLVDLWGMLDRAATAARTVGELSQAYRGAVRDIELAMSRPDDARQDRSIRRALAFIRDHLGEPLRAAKVARVAGFAPGYFSKVFVRTEHTTFQRYVRQQRLERAKHLLLSTTLSAERIGQLCGFVNRSHFHRVFRQTLGMAPLEYRSRAAAPVRASRFAAANTASR